MDSESEPAAMNQDQGHNADGKIASFLEWCRAEGIWIDPRIHICSCTGSTGDGIGVFAREGCGDIDVDECCTLCFSLFLSSFFHSFHVLADPLSLPVTRLPARNVDSMLFPAVVTIPKSSVLSVKSSSIRHLLEGDRNLFGREAQMELGLVLLVEMYVFGNVPSPFRYSPYSRYFLSYYFLSSLRLHLLSSFLLDSVISSLPYA
jgi:hypothetical protein